MRSAEVELRNCVEPYKFSSFLVASGHRVNPAAASKPRLVSGLRSDWPPVIVGIPRA